MGCSMFQVTIITTNENNDDNDNDDTYNTRQRAVAKRANAICIGVQGAEAGKKRC